MSSDVQSATLTCPGKVFIVGEYACIEGGPSLVATVDPVFGLEIRKEPGRHAPPFAAASPAGLLLSRRNEVLGGVRLVWSDPYDTPIGVGSSSAQFLLSVAAVSDLSGLPRPSAAEVLALYWESVGASQGLRPSGVDVVAQWLGGPVVARNQPFEARKIAPWSGDAEFLLAFTGSKAKTHEHLQALRERGFPGKFAGALDALNAITLDAIEAWETADSAALGRLLSDYQRALLQGGLAPAAFTAEIARAAKLAGVLGAKGSGAQGGDCVLILARREGREALHAALREQLGWTPIPLVFTSRGLS